MKTLYLDTSSSFLYCAIIDDGSCVGEIRLNLERDLSSLALDNIQNLFNTVHLTPKDIDKIIVVNGPGSFTGIRVGLSIAKTYAWSLKKEITTISSLDAMALSDDNEYDYYIPLIDARRGYVYAGIYDKDNNQIMKNQYINLEVLKITADNLPGSYVFISNDELDIEYTVDDYSPDFVKIVNYYQNKEGINPHAIDALYLKLTEAEEKLNDN